MAHTEGKLNLKKSYNIVDLETTGLAPNSDCIVEIGMILVRNGVIEEKYRQLIHPAKPIPKQATAINHITNDMLKDQPDIDQIVPIVFSKMRQYPVVGHNVTFDMNFLQATGMDFSLKGKRKYFDTLKFARKHFTNMAHHRLSDMAEHYHIDVTNAHSALGDCETTYELLQAYISEFGEGIFVPEELVKRQEAVNDATLPFE